jgi:uncharacterized membrane protein
VILLAAIQWHPRLAPFWCAALLLAFAAWGWLLWQRLRRRVPLAARWIALPKWITLLLLLLALFDPVSMLQKSEPARGRLLALVDSSSSMDVADDYHQSRAARARAIVEEWKKSLPAGVALDELAFDTTIHKPDQPPSSALRGTDLGGCLLALSERGDLASYLGVVLLTDGGDEAIEEPTLPGVPLSIVGIGTDPATWNDLAITDAQAPATAEKDTDFEISADLVARTGHGGGFSQTVTHTHVLLEHATGTNWEKVADTNVNLATLSAHLVLSARSSQLGPQRYRVTIQPASGELSTLNNSRTVTVNVQKKALHVLYFTLELGQEFKMLRNELGRDPGLSFTALFRSAGARFILQGDRVSGDDALAAGFPSSKDGLKLYDVIIIGSFPAEQTAPRQMQALLDFVQEGGTLIFLGDDDSFGRGGYAGSPLEVLFPWRISSQEPAPAQGSFAVGVPPMASGHPILATVEETVTRTPVRLDSLNRVGELKPNATALLTAQMGDRGIAVVAVQPFGKGKVMGIATDTLWKWALQPEPLRSAYGLFWRQAVRNLTGKTEGGQNLSVRWDKDFYRPGDLAAGEIRVLGGGAGVLRFTASLSRKDQSQALEVAPLPGQAQTYQVKPLFRDRGDYDFRLVAYQGDRVLEAYEKTFAIAPRVEEGSRLELDEVFLKRLATLGGGAYYREADAGQFIERIASRPLRKIAVEESSLVEAGPWFVLVFLAVLVLEWTLRRKVNLF